MLVRGPHRTDWPGRFGRTGVLTPPPAGGRILLHAVSVGEVGALRGLVEAIEARADVDVVIASTTDTGVARATALFGQRHTIVRWPLDFSMCVGRFLSAVQPTVLGMVELEVWPNMTALCRKRGIRAVVLTGRLSARSHQRYRLIRPLVRGMFRRIDAVGAQDRTIADRFIDLGVPADRVEVTGNMKWDSAVVPKDGPARSAQLAQRLGIDASRLLLVGGSTAPGEEAMLRAACPRDVQLLCAPRRPEWWGDAEVALSPCRKLSTANEPGEAVDRYLLDTIGDLSDAYGLADVVVVGRSFGELHGSDPIEPIARGAATVIGPAVCDFAEAVAVLKAGHGLVQCEESQLAGTLAELLADTAARAKLASSGAAVIATQQGATARSLELLLAAPNAPPPNP
jgi:3-deoxy-D-manno-octulosonic-acid transferase